MNYFLDFDLPRELIAAEPSPLRGEDRMMVLKGGQLLHGSFQEALSHLRSGDLLVFNNSKVFKARLFFMSPLGFQSELLLIRRLDARRWTAMVKKARRLREGDELSFGGRRASVGQTFPDGLRELIFAEPFAEADAAPLGQIPLPPYIIRERKRRSLPLYTSADEERYQTVFAKPYGSVAAPTASLRFTPSIIQELQGRGIRTCEVTLHVGIGTFKPMDAPPDEFHIHSEQAEIPKESAELIAQTLAEGGRIIASGTTVCRTLEAFGGQARIGEADIFIKPGHTFKVTQGLITNFHLPQSTLLLLVQALAGVEPTRRAYAEAVGRGYHFFSYGDGMMILP